MQQSRGADSSVMYRWEACYNGITCIWTWNH